MLIKIEGFSEISTTTFKLKLKIPFIFLDNEDYTLSVRRLAFSCKKPIDKAFFSLHSSAVDKSLINPDQEIAQVYNKGSNYIWAQPPTPLRYKIQLKDIHSADFILKTTSKLETKIENFVLILEILRDVRIQ